MFRNRLLAAALVSALVLAPAAASAHKLGDAHFHFKTGKHDAQGEGFRAHLPKSGKKPDRKVKFEVMFDKNTSYTINAADQSDCNKVMGISVVRIHEDSVRLGWAWDPKAGKMQLSFYAYYNGNRSIQPLLQVGLGEWVPVTITMNDKGMSVTAGSAHIEKNVDLGWKALTISAILRTAYFGGQSTAPHEMDVHVRNIDAD